MSQIETHILDVTGYYGQVFDHLLDLGIIPMLQFLVTVSETSTKFVHTCTSESNSNNFKQSLTKSDKDIKVVRVFHTSCKLIKIWSTPKLF